MQIYLVRRIEDHGILGIFWGSKADVWDCVDEVADPADYEYAAIRRPGGLYHGGEKEPQAVQFAMDYEGENAPDFTFEGYEPSELLSDAVYNQASLRWYPFDGACEGVGIIARAVERVRQGA